MSKKENEKKSKSLEENQSHILKEREENENNFALTRTRATTTVIRQSPIPTAQELEEYKKLDKSFPDWILSMTEKEQKFRHHSTYLGQINFIIIIAIGFGFSVYAGVNQAQFVGSVIAGAIGYITYVFKSNKPKPPTPTKENNKEEQENA